MPAAHSRFARVRDHVAPRPPPAAVFDRFVYGLTQPLLGARMLATHRRLLEAALLPAALLAAFCAGIALLGGGDGFLRRFYTTFAVLAPLPSIVLASHYARLAAQARHAFGFSRVEPCIEPLGRTLRRALKQSILVGFSLAPITLLLKLVPGIGRPLVQAIVALWALHWVVVESFDSARVLHPGQTLADLDAAALRMPPPWFVRWLRHAADRVPVASLLLRRLARFCDRMSVSWREEIALVEANPVLMAGFAVATAVTLALPVLNLAFRPIVIVAACHVLGQLEAAERGDRGPLKPDAAS